ncbi:hypothetical protein FO519_000399 [Halicephalobus sp. NKZ332]|nr:hypothetical protein FO519_000399 [Halicephalobus sp. NKZ332]
MAFIVPVVRRDFVLYNSAEKKKERSISNPLEMRKKNEPSRKLSRSTEIVGSSPLLSPTSKSAPVTPMRRRSHRISIRRLSSEFEDPECPQSAPPNLSQRHVRFGFLEEIEFNENDENEEQIFDNEPYTPTKSTVIQPCLKMPNRSCALEATVPSFKKNAMLKLVTFCSKS